MPELHEHVRRWREHPLQFVRERFRVERFDPWQEQVLEDFPHHPQQVMMACKGPGKTATLSWLGWNFLATRPHPKIGATSITGKNLHDNLWAEMAKWRKVDPMLEDQFHWSAERIFFKQHPETWFMTAKSWPQTANEQELGSTLAGLWADYLLFLIDEAGDIPIPVMRTAEAVLGQAAMQGREAHVVMAGNCTSTTGCLYEAAIIRRHLWKTYSITADPDDPNRTSRIDPEYARAQIREYGRDNPWVRINILAQFPDQGVNQLISADEVRACMGRHLHPNAYSWAPKILGGDVAGFGDDRSVLFPRQGQAYLKPLILRSQDPLQLAGHWMEKASTWGADSIQVDATGGYGTGTIAIMSDQGYSVMPVDFASKARNPKFFNKRAEIWWEACQHLKEGASLPRDDGDPEYSKLVAELSAPTYSYKGDRILIEPKEMVKARLGRSPDLADALCCTHAFPVAATARTREGLALFDLSSAIGKSKTDYDPLNR